MGVIFPILCGHIDKANRDRERFLCTECGHFDHADKQAARNIKRKAVIEYGLKLIKVPMDCGKPKQLTLFETPSTELTVSCFKEKTRHPSG